MPQEDKDGFFFVIRIARRQRWGIRSGWSGFDEVNLAAGFAVQIPQTEPRKLKKCGIVKCIAGSLGDRGKGGKEDGWESLGKLAIR